MAKKFFYVCAGILMLAASYHLGAKSASAQASGSSIVALGPNITTYSVTAITAGGDFYASNGGPWTFLGNVFTGTPPTPVKQQSWGAVQQRYR